MLLEYRITDKGYRIVLDKKDWIIQEGFYATIYPGKTTEERAQNHLNKILSENGVLEE